MAFKNFTYWQAAIRQVLPSSLDGECNNDSGEHPRSKYVHKYMQQVAGVAAAFDGDHVQLEGGQQV